MQQRPQVPLNLVAALLLFYSGAEHPYSYYTTLRWVTLIAALVTAYVMRKAGLALGVWTFVAVAILFNPIFMVTMTKESWRPIDFVVGILMVVGCAVSAPTTSKES